MKLLGRNVSSDNDFLSDLPRLLTDENVQKFAAKASKDQDLSGREKFYDTLEDKTDSSQSFVSEKYEVVAYIEKERENQFDVHSVRRICHISYQYLISTEGVLISTKSVS